MNKIWWPKLGFGLQKTIMKNELETPFGDFVSKLLILCELSSECNILSMIHQLETQA